MRATLSYGRRGIFEPAFLEWLERDFRLSDYELSVRDGQLSLSFHGLWTETTMWEIYALSAIDELKTRASLKRLSEFELDILYARAKTRLWEKMERLRGVPELSVSDFGTRRRHSFLWHEYVVTPIGWEDHGHPLGHKNRVLRSRRENWRGRHGRGVSGA